MTNTFMLTKCLENFDWTTSKSDFDSDPEWDLCSDPECPENLDPFSNKSFRIRNTGIATKMHVGFLISQLDERCCGEIFSGHLFSDIILFAIHRKLRNRIAHLQL